MLSSALVVSWATAAPSAVHRSLDVKVSDLGAGIPIAVEVGFSSPASNQSTLEGIMESQIRSAEALYPGRDLLVQAYLGDIEYPGSPYGTPRTYSQRKHRFLSEDESRNAVSKIETRKGYTVQLKATPVPGGKKYESISLVYLKVPNLDRAYRDAATEVVAFVRGNHDAAVEDVNGAPFVGDPNVPDTWNQLAANGHGYALVGLDRKANTVINVATKEVLARDVRPH